MSAPPTAFTQAVAKYVMGVWMLTEDFLHCDSFRFWCLHFEQIAEQVSSFVCDAARTFIWIPLSSVAWPPWAPQGCTACMNKVYICFRLISLQMQPSPRGMLCCASGSHRKEHWPDACSTCMSQLAAAAASAVTLASNCSTHAIKRNKSRGIGHSS